MPSFDAYVYLLLQLPAIVFLRLFACRNRSRKYNNARYKLRAYRMMMQSLQFDKKLASNHYGSGLPESAFKADCG